jgi:hypothetical protein
MIGTASVERPAGDALPFFMVTRVDGDDDKVWDYPVVDVDVFNVDRNTANLVARTAHRKMLSLRPDDVISLPGGGTASVDEVCTEHGPRFVDWELDTMQRYVMRYQIMLRFNRAGGS